MRCLQTYTQNLEHYQHNGPIFIYVGDGGVYTNEWIQGGLMFDIARQVNAALATADHRYFGRNRPTPTASFEDLQFLTVDQALGDLSVLISTIRADLGTTGRVILWGTGYGASLATHARKKFPHLVDGVWASSGYFRAEAIDTGKKRLAVHIRMRTQHTLLAHKQFTTTRCRRSSVSMAATSALSASTPLSLCCSS